jgi:molybdopterin converting factor small subunit
MIEDVPQRVVAAARLWAASGSRPSPCAGTAQSASPRRGACATLLSECSSACAPTTGYHNILRRHTGIERETIQLPAETSLHGALEKVADRYGPHLRDMLFASDGTVTNHLVVFHNGQLARQDAHTVQLADGDELMLFPAISGGEGFSTDCAVYGLGRGWDDRDTDPWSNSVG